MVEGTAGTQRSTRELRQAYRLRVLVRRRRERDFLKKICGT